MKSIADGFEDVTAVRNDDTAEEGIVNRQSGPHRLRILFPKLRASFNVRKEECKSLS